jgi:hypothetical protein
VQLLIESRPIRRLSQIQCYHNKVEVFIHSAIAVILFEMMMTLTIYSSPASHHRYSRSLRAAAVIIITTLG